MSTPFERAVDTVLRSLRSGEVVTYGEVATEAGCSPRASRAVGGFLARHGDQYPWWRVVTASGRLVPGHEVEHARRLRAEGVKVRGNRVRRARMAGMATYDHPVAALDGGPADLSDHRQQAALIVNVASRCGLTPQYEGLERLHERFADRGFSVLGFPCNQFGGQEPGSAEEIATFCSTTYGVTFPMYEKIDVNGEHRHPLYGELTVVPDQDGYTGDIRWNFEKFVIAPGGEVVARFDPTVEPEADQVVSTIEGVLPSKKSSAKPHIPLASGDMRRVCPSPRPRPPISSAGPGSGPRPPRSRR